MSNFGLSATIGKSIGEFSTYKPTEPIPLNLYGLLPQLQWNGGKACVPVAITNALAGMAAFYKKPELLVSGEDNHNQLLNTYQKLAVYLKTTSEGVGTEEKDIKEGMPKFLAAEGLENVISLNPCASTAGDQIFTKLIAAFAKGPVVLFDEYDSGEGGHAVTAAELKFNDANNNMRLDKGEAFVTIIDPLNPVKNENYVPKILDVSGLTTEEKLQSWNETIQAGPNAQPLLKEVEIYQGTQNPENSGLLKFNYKQSVISEPPLEASGFSVEITPEKVVQGKFKGFLGLYQSSLQDNINELIAPSNENEVVFDFSGFIENGKVSGELFSYFNEGSSLNNNLSFYQLADSSGTVIDPVSGDKLSPGDNGYTEAAQKQAKIFEASDTSNSNADLNGRVSADQTQMGSFSFSLDSVGGKALFAPIVNTSAGDVWTTFGEANRDGKDHFKWMGGLSFQMEDQFGLGDRDFNDLQVVLTPLEINGVA